MARIPDDELERLKREVPVAELAREGGVELKQVGKELRGCCPFHEDATPSLSVDPERNVFHCFGCGAKGSAVDWVMRAEGASFRHAAEILRERLGLSPVDEGETLPGRRLACPLDMEADDATILTQVALYYHETMRRAPQARQYLELRGIWSDEAVATFKLGYADRTLGLRLPPRELKAGRPVRQRLQDLGLFYGSGHESFRGRVTVPVFDLDGKVVELYGRRIADTSKTDTPEHLYLKGPHRGVWNLDAFRDSRELILCEALLDALTLWVNGFRATTAAYGTNGFTRDHLETMKAYGTRSVLIAYDRDRAGDEAAAKLAERLGHEGISCFRVELPHEMDVNSFARKVTPAPRSLEVVLRSARHLAGPVATLVVVRAPSPEPDDGAEAEPELHASEPEPAPPSVAPFPPPLPSPTTDHQLPATTISDHEVVITLGERSWRARGLERSTTYEQLKLNLFVTAGERFHVDTLDLYSSRQRAAFVKQAAVELAVKPEVVHTELGKVLLRLEQVKHERLVAALEPEPAPPPMSESERAEALDLLEDPRLLDRVASDLERCGLVGERTNKLVAYLAAVSRKLAKPLAVMVQSSSAAGKSALMNAVLALLPPEERVQYSAMTGQSLFYMGEADLKHKVLAIAEEEGAERASYALKLLQSEGELSIASTGKDPKSGRLVTHDYHVEGPVAILLTTTAIDLDEELQNRCVVLAVDESREQTRAIHRRQRFEETIEGQLALAGRGAIRRQHRNAQRLLEPMPVHNPFTAGMSFPDSCTRTRRDHQKYLALIRSVTLLHQRQRRRSTLTRDGRPVEYLVATLSDVEVANHLASEILGRTLDELPPQTRGFLELVHAWVVELCREQQLSQSSFRFSRRQVREHTGWSLTQVSVHLERLVEMEYVLVHRGGRGQSFVYELLWQGQGTAGERFVIGLVDLEQARRTGAGDAGNLTGSGDKLTAFSHDLTASGDDLTGSKRGRIGGMTGLKRPREIAPSSLNPEDSSDSTEQGPKNAHRGSRETAPSPSYSSGRNQVEEDDVPVLGTAAR